VTWDRIRAVKGKFERFLLSRANVVGVGVGKKIVRGKETDDPAVIVFVERKLPESQLKKKDIVPKTLEDVKTDVVETGRLRALSAPATEAQSRTDRWRPALGGVSIGHFKVTAGTLGGVVRRGDERLILSNNHVLANENDARRGDPILQPAPADRGGTDDTIARLDGFVEIRFDGGNAEPFLRRLANRLGLRPVAEPPPNFVDAAIAKPVEDNLVDDSILGLGTPSGVADAGVSEMMRKSGRTTGITSGRVLATEATVRVQYGRDTATFADQVVASPMSRGGDSGSLVLNERNEVVGLLFAGSDTATVWNRSRRVMDALGIEFYTS